MQHREFRSLLSLAESASLPPPPDKRAKLRGAIQQRFNGMNHLVPELMAKVSALTPKLIGQEVSEEDAREVDRICQELGDIAQKIGTQSEALRTAVSKFRTAVGGDR